MTLAARVLNLAALAFTILVSGVLLLGVDYSKLKKECLRKDECNVWEVSGRVEGGWRARRCGTRRRQGRPQNRRARRATSRKKGGLHAPPAVPLPGGRVSPRVRAHLVQAALRRHPLPGGLSLWNALSVAYLAVFSGYWVFALVREGGQSRGTGSLRW